MSQIVEESGEQPPEARADFEPASGPQTGTEAGAEPGFEAQPDLTVSAPPEPGLEPSPPLSRRERRKQVRKTRVVVRRVGPISVLKLSLIFYFCLMLIVFGGLLILYGIMSATDVMKNLADVIAGFGLTDAEKGEFVINGEWLFTRIFIAGFGMVVAGALINLLVAFLYNMISDVVGGVEVTLAEKRSRG